MADLKRPAHFVFRSDENLTPEQAELRIENDEIFDNDPARDKKLSRRRIARERVLQILYSSSMNDRNIDELFKELVLGDTELNEQAIEFSRSLLRNFNAHHDVIDALITERLANWDFKRVALIDKILLQIGIAEFLYFPEIPPKATINELIEIAKDFSTDESSKFINGILHKIKDDLIAKGEMNKEGRGLIDQSIGGTASDE